MAINIEILSPSNWDMLLPEVSDAPAPDKSVCVIAKDDAAKIIGTMFIVAPVHLEGAWIKEGQRSGVVLAWLVKKCEDIAARAGLEKVFAYAIDATMENYIKRLGYTKVPVTVWEKAVK